MSKSATRKATESGMNIPDPTEFKNRVLR